MACAVVVELELATVPRPLNELEEYAAVLSMFFNSTRNIGK